MTSISRRTRSGPILAATIAALLTPANADETRDFCGLDATLNATLDLLAGEIVRFDVDGDDRLSTDDVVESIPIIANPCLVDYDENGVVDDFDLFLARYDADGDGGVTYPIAFATNLTVGLATEFEGVDDELARLIDEARPDRDGDGSVTMRDVVLGYRDGVLDGRDAGPREDVVAATTHGLAEAAIAAGPNAEFVPPKDGVWEPVPFGSTRAHDYALRPIFRDYTFRDLDVPLATNALFEGCTFVGATFLASEPGWTGSPPNSVRFHDCTFLGPDVHLRLSAAVQITGAARRFLQPDEVDPPTLEDAAGVPLMEYLETVTAATRVDLVRGPETPWPATFRRGSYGGVAAPYVTAGLPPATGPPPAY